MIRECGYIFMKYMEFCIGGNLSVWLKFFLESSSSSIVDVFVDDDFEESGDDKD